MIHCAKTNDIQVADMFLQAQQERIFTKAFMAKLYSGLMCIDHQGRDMFLIEPDSEVHARNIFNRLTQKQPIPLREIQTACTERGVRTNGKKRAKVGRDGNAKA